ncbi:MAG: hypothetical protein CMJ83_10745 [Planctomycetes bacterium]|nr:hypothetical protein [Planctomycetota bacterium]
MSLTGLLVLAAVGAVIALLPQYFATRPGRSRSLTTWILSSMGVGIAVGALFAYSVPFEFRPLPASVTGTVEGPFDLRSGLTLTVTDAGGAKFTDLKLDPDPARQPMTAAEVAAEFNRQQTSVRASHDGDRIVISTMSKGNASSLQISDATAGQDASRLGFQANVPVTGEGEPKSFWRDLHTFFKDIFLNALKMMIVPVIFTSIVAGMLSLGSQGLGRLGFKTLAYYLTTSLLAIIVGLLLVNAIGPGVGAIITLEHKPSGFEETANQSTEDFLFNFFRNLIPANPIKAMVDGKILQVIFFALFIGYFINRLPTRFRESLTTFFNGLFELMLLIVRTLLWLAPLGVYAIFVKIIGETGPEAFIDLGWYALTVFAGLCVHAFIILPLLLKFVGGLNPWRHFKAMAPALLTAFSTSSSSATLPMTLRCVKERVGISDRTSSFILPLGATVNMDGTALYECVAAIFIAQVYISAGVMDPLTMQQQFLVVFTALAASIGAAGVPMAGMVMLGIILNALGMPLEGVGYVLAVDRILDMCRTTVNVWSDSCGCAVIAKTEGEDQVLQKWPPPSLT